MKQRPYIIFWVLSMALVIFFTRSCGSDLVTDVITIPAMENTKIITAPLPVVKKDTFFLETGEIKIVTVPNPINQEMMTKYYQTKDTLERLKLYQNAIEIREYVETLKDSTQIITVLSSVSGELREQIISYRTLPMEFPRTRNTSKNALFIGLSGGLPLDPNFNTFTAGIKADVVTKNKIYSLGYDSQKRINIGLSIKLF